MWFFHFAPGRCRILAPGGNNACGDSWIQGAPVVIATGAHRGLPWGPGDALPCSTVFGAVDAFPSQLLRAVIDALRDCPGSYHVLLSPRQAQRTSGAGLLVQGCWECGSCPPAPITVSRNHTVWHNFLCLGTGSPREREPAQHTGSIVRLVGRSCDEQAI